MDSSIDTSTVAVNENVKLMLSDADVDKAVAGNNNGTFFKNGFLKVDVVLAYEVNDNDKMKEQKARNPFEDPCSYKFLSL